MISCCKTLFMFMLIVLGRYFHEGSTQQPIAVDWILVEPFEWDTISPLECHIWLEAY